jgi:hypothetical protein
MSRRTKASVAPTKTLASVGGVLALMLGGYLLLGKSDPFRTLSVFPTKEYLENANSLSGNTYKLEATVDKTLESSKEHGRLISVEVGAGDMLPLLVPQSLGNLNVDRNQKLVFKVQVADNGLITASEIRKP